jgi:predicted amidohydrolase
VLWAATQIGGGWRLAAGMGLGDTSIETWPLTLAPDLHVSCLCAESSHHHHGGGGGSNETMLDRINARLAAGDDLILLSEAALRQRIRPDELSWPEDNPGAVVAVTFTEPVQNVVPNTTSTKLYNSIELLQAGQSIMRYDKNRPVPVMETPYVAAGNEPPRPTEVVFTPFMPSTTAIATGTWQEEEDEQMQSGRTSVTIRVAAAICFDFDFPDVLRHARTADLVIGPSNYWSSLGRNLWSDNMYRAIESGFTLVKCARNGISGAVDPLGRTLAAIPTLAGDTYTAQVPVQPGVSTIYAHYGGYRFGWACVGLSVAWILVALFGPLAAAPAAPDGEGGADHRAGDHPDRNVGGDAEATGIVGSEVDGGLEAPLLSQAERDGLDDAAAPLLSTQEQQQQEAEEA